MIIPSELNLSEDKMKECSTPECLMHWFTGIGSTSQSLLAYVHSVILTVIFGGFLSRQVQSLEACEPSA
jgi:hypothetical protein